MIPSALPGSAMVVWLRQMSASGGLSPSKLHHVFPWLLRYSLLELPRLYERLRYDRAIAAQAVPNDPVFIVGHWRSGTSYLQELIGSDPQFATCSTFDAMFPECLLSTRAWLKPTLDFALRSFGTPYRAQNRPLQLDLPAEDDFFSLCLGDRDSAYWGHVFPCAARRYFLESNSHGAWLDGHRYLTRKLSLAYPGRRLLLKSPPHTARIAALMSAYPKASFILLHRHPVETFVSSQRLWRLIDRQTGLQATNPADTDRLIVDVFEHMMSRYVDDRDRLQPERLVEIPLVQLSRAPIETLEDIYRRLDLGEVPVDAVQPVIRRAPEPVVRNPVVAPNVEQRLRRRLEPAFELGAYE